MQLIGNIADLGLQFHMPQDMGGLDAATLTRELDSLGRTPRLGEH
jgi:hypothetical protein